MSVEELITGLELATWALVRQVTKLLATKGVVQAEAEEWRLYLTGMEISDYAYAEEGNTWSKMKRVKDFFVGVA